MKNVNSQHRDELLSILNKQSNDIVSVKTTGNKKNVVLILCSVIIVASIPYALAVFTKNFPSTKATTKIISNESDIQKVNRSEPTLQEAGQPEDKKFVLSASGYVVPRLKATVSSKVTGRIKQVLVDEGEFVEANDVVAILDDTNVVGELRVAIMEHQAALARVQEVKALMLQSDLALQRTKKLLSEGFSNQANLEVDEANYSLLTAQLATRQAEAKRAESIVDVHQRRLNDLRIKAPFSGVVVNINAHQGEMISPNSAGGGFTRTGICSIMDMSSLEVEVDISELQIDKVYPKQEVIVIPDAYQSIEIPAHVLAIVPTADRQKATVKVRVKFDELVPKIIPEMSVRVRFLKEI